MKFYWLKRLLCLVGLHWQGRKNQGMFGDAATCDFCGADAYGLRVIHDTNPLKDASFGSVLFSEFYPKRSNFVPGSFGYVALPVIDRDWTWHPEGE